MIDQNAAQLVMLNAKNRVHKAIRTATSLQTRPTPPITTTSTAATTTVPAAAATPTRQARTGRYHAYTAIDGDDPDEDWPPDDDFDEYGDRDNYPEEREYDEYGLVETDQAAAPDYQGAAGGRPYSRGRGRGRGYRGRGNITCHQCGGRGHMARACPSPARGSGR